MTMRALPLCAFCIRVHPWKGMPAVCDAFPDGIPATILDSVQDHRRHVEGDHDLHFAPDSDEAIHYAEKVFDAP